MLKFEQMNEADFSAFLRKSVPEYAYDQMRSGNWTANEAAGRARAEFQTMLPNGPQTPNAYLRTVLDEQGHKIGMLWYFIDSGRSRKTAFLIDFFIFPEGRHKGYEAQAFALFENEARELGVERVELQIFTHKNEDVLLYRENGYIETSIFFAKDLVARRAGMIELVPMTEADFQVYLAKIIPEYAAEKVQVGNWVEAEALENSRKTYENLLPQGIHTPGNFVGKLVNENGESVGFLWYELNKKRASTAFIFDFEILTSFRRQGYGFQAMLALETHARARGVKRLELHVFGNNTAARELYKKVGYIETNVNMARDI